MFRIIDFDVDYSGDGVQGYIHRLYLLLNVNTGTKKWVYEDEKEIYERRGFLVEGGASE